MPTSASGSYSLPTLRFQNSKPGSGSASAGHSLFNTLVDMASGIREARIQGGGGGGGTGSITTGQIASFTACVGDVLGTAVRAGDGLTVSAGTHDIEVKVSAIATSMITSFTACVRDAANSGFVAGNGITFSTSGHSLEIKTATLTVGQMLSFTANVGQAINVGITAGTAIVLSFNAATNVTEIRASITSGGGIASFTACVGDAMFPNLKAGTNVAYSFNAGTHQTEINVTGSLGAISSLTASVHEMVSDQTATRYVDDYGTVADGTTHPLSETYASLTAAVVDYPYALALTDEKDYLAVLTALYDAPTGSGGVDSIVHVQLGNKTYFWGSNTFTPTRAIRLSGWNTMEGDDASRILHHPRGHGIVVNDNGAAGSIFEGFRLNMSATGTGITTYCGGTIREYNPDIGMVVISKNDSASSMTASTTFETRTVLSLGDTPAGTFIATGVDNPYGAPDYSIEISGDVRLFTVGETVSWPSGGSATIAYIGYTVRALFVTTPAVANPVFGEVITGGTSGATGIVLQGRTNGVRVRAITVLTGNVDTSTTNEDDHGHFCRVGEFGHGLLINRRCYADSLEIRAAVGNGIYVAAGGGGYSGNSNLTRVMRCKTSDCGGNGIAVSGADANVVTVGEGTMTENSGYAVVDNSFLGAIVYGNHVSGGAIGGFYFGGGNSISFGNYAEGNEDRYPFRHKGTRILSGALDMLGTSGVDRFVRGSGSRIGGGVGGEFRCGPIDFEGSGTTCVIRTAGHSTGGIADDRDPCLRVENGGNSSSAAGASIEMAIPWDAGTNFDSAKNLAYTSCRLTTHDRGSAGRTVVNLKVLRNFGSYAVRARAGSSFKGRINVASAGTITSVTTLLTGASSTSFSDTISIVNPGAGVGAVLAPVIRRGKIVDVDVLNGGSGYSRTFSLATAISMADDYVSIWSNVTGQDSQLTTSGLDTNVNLSIAPKGTGIVKVPSTVQFARTCTIVAGSVTASADLTLTPSGNGRVRFGEFTTTATTMLVTGYIEIRDAAGNIRKLAVVG